MSGNLYNAFRMDGGTRPLILGDDGLSYDQMRAQSGRLANALVTLGVRRGDRVAVQVEKSVAALALYLASLRVGAIFLPLNTAYTLEELAFFVGDAEPALVVCAPEIAGDVARLPGCADRVYTLDPQGRGSLTDAAASQAPDFATLACDPDAVAAILYTSGTTGRPKGAMLSHANLLSNTEALRDAWRFTGDDVLLHALPIYHAHGLFVACNLMMLVGGSMHFLPRFDADQAVALLPACTAMMGVPTFYTRLLGHPALATATRDMRLFISGSAPLLPETHRQWSERTGHAILERYGMTETTMLTSNPYEGARVPGSVGMPLPGVGVRISDPETGQAQPQGEVGMIEVSGPNIFKGYWKLPEKTAEEFRDDGYFITGDLGRIDADGYLYIVGRGKDLVITGGLNVYPREVEAVIDEIPGVQESAVIGVPHADFGEGVTAVVVRQAEAEITEQAIMTGLQGRLSRFKQPKRVVFLEELPRNTMGKVQKNLLRDRYRALYAKA
ncbi:malonate--CoA ligase [Antarctobacter sp.]|uniref:malonate--CoA ligase n=1 Tax=Antarctobacter sp. TaxID=1872577 RepID=UPI003A95385F